MLCNMMSTLTRNVALQNLTTEQDKDASEIVVGCHWRQDRASEWRDEPKEAGMRTLLEMSSGYGFVSICTK